MNNPDALVPVMCWCGRKMVQVPKDLVGYTTNECGRKGCGEDSDAQDR